MAWGLWHFFEVEMVEKRKTFADKSVAAFNNQLLAIIVVYCTGRSVGECFACNMSSDIMCCLDASAVIKLKVLNMIQ